MNSYKFISISSNIKQIEPFRLTLFIRIIQETIAFLKVILNYFEQLDYICMFIQLSQWLNFFYCQNFICTIKRYSIMTQWKNYKSSYSLYNLSNTLQPQIDPSVSFWHLCTTEYAPLPISPRIRYSNRKWQLWDSSHVHGNLALVIAM